MISGVGNRGISLNARELLEPDSINSANADMALPATTIGGFSVARPAFGRAIINLKDGYQLAINDIDRQIVLENRTAKSSTIIWGDAAISPSISVPPAPLSSTSAPSTPITSTSMPTVSALTASSAVASPLAVPATVAIVEPPPHLAMPVAAVQSAPAACIETTAAAPLAIPAPATTNAPLTTLSPTPTLVTAPAPAHVSLSALAPTPPLASAPQPPLQFWGTISFTFGNDQKITLNTLPAPAGDGSYVIDKIVVSSESNGLIISGAADQKPGALNIEAADGYDLDENTRDGLTLEECVNGTGWINEDGIALSQSVLNETAVGADYAPGSTLLSMREMSTILSRIFSFNFISSMMSSVVRTRDVSSQTSEIRTDNEKSNDRRRVERLVVDQILAQQAAETRRIDNGITLQT